MAAPVTLTSQQWECLAEDIGRGRYQTSILRFHSTVRQVIREDLTVLAVRGLVEAIFFTSTGSLSKGNALLPDGFTAKEEFADAFYHLSKDRAINWSSRVSLERACRANSAAQAALEHSK